MHKWTVVFLLSFLQGTQGAEFPIQEMSSEDEEVVESGSEQEEVDESDEELDEPECKKRAEEILIFSWALYWKQKNGSVIDVTYEEEKNSEDKKIIRRVILEPSGDASVYVPAWHEVLEGRNPFYVVQSEDIDLEMLCGHMNGAFNENSDDKEELKRAWKIPNRILNQATLARQRRTYLGLFSPLNNDSLAVIENFHRLNLH